MTVLVSIWLCKFSQYTFYTITLLLSTTCIDIHPNTLEMLIDNGNTSNLVWNACRRIIATLRLNFGRGSLRC